MSAEITIGLNAAIFAVTGEEPRILTLEEGGRPALPFGPLDPRGDHTLELGLRGWVREQAELELGYVEQLYTFGDRDRQADTDGGGRALSVAYLALLREDKSPASGADWRDAYSFLPWEDWRSGRPGLIDRVLIPRLASWAREEEGLSGLRTERVEIAFGSGGAKWDEERVLDRYELLYEGGLIAEARTERVEKESRSGRTQPGLPMALDHRRILATALGRLRGKLKYRPLVFELVPPSFTLLQLQRVVEALAGIPLHKQNFRRLVENGGLVEGTGKLEMQTGGRPAELFAFRREVLHERPTPGVGLPGLPPRS